VANLRVCLLFGQKPVFAIWAEKGDRLAHHVMTDDFIGLAVIGYSFADLGHLSADRLIGGEFVVEAAEQALAKLKRQVKKVFIGGVSLGGNIAFMVAKNSRVDGIISMGTPIRFRNEEIGRILYVILRFFKDFYKKHYRTADIPIVKNKVHYHKIPIKKVNDVLILIRKSKRALEKIIAPTLVMQSSSDHQLDNNNAEFIYRKLGSKNKKLVYIPDSYHVFICDKHRHLAFKEILDFVKGEAA